MVERYLLFLAGIVFLGQASFVASNDDVLKRNDRFQRIFARNLKSFLKPKIKDSGFDRHEERDLINGFNYIRSNVEPSAADMIKLTWSDGLAKLAKQWGDLCPSEKQFGPEDCPKLYSQNVFKSDSDDVSYVLYDWDSEREFYKFDSNSCDDVCKNYKMLIRAEFHSVGCSRSICGPGPDNYTFVCNFYPPAKDGDSRPYKKGPTCSNCPNNEKCDRTAEICEKTDRHVPLDELSACSGIALPTNPSVTLFRDDDDDYEYSAMGYTDEQVSIGLKPFNNMSLMILSLIEVLALILD